MSGYALALAFDRQGRDFVLGVEVGRLWEMLKAAPDEPLEQDMHADNAEMVLRIAEALDRSVESDDCDDNWILVRFGASRSSGGADG